MNRTTSKVLDRMIDDAAADLAAFRAEIMAIAAIVDLANVNCSGNLPERVQRLREERDAARAALAAAPAGAGMR